MGSAEPSGSATYPKRWSAAACAVVWYEFLCGPVSDQHKNLAYAVLNGRIEPVTEAAAQLAADLFNKTGRTGRLRTDALVAACAITKGAKFATINHADFVGFVGHGLRLI